MNQVAIILVAYILLARSIQVFPQIDEPQSQNTQTIDHSTHLKCTIRPLNATSVTVRCKDPPSASNRDANQPMDNLWLQVTYQLNIHFLNVNLTVKLRDQLCLLQSHKNYLSDIRESCEDSLFSFTDGSNLVANHCTNKSQIYLIPPTSDFSVIIGNLLPYQVYDFEIMSKAGLLHMSSICLDGSRPLYPPATDIGSFLKESRAIHWQPIPFIFGGDSKFSYDVECQDMMTRKLVINNTSLDGTLDTKLTDYGNGLDCKLWTRNHFSRSDKYSRVIVPNATDLFHLPDGAKFYATAVTNHEYKLKWTPVTKGLRGGQVVELTDPIYTIYWCTVVSQNFGCGGIGGMNTTNSSELQLGFPEHPRPKVRNFGWSVRDRKAKYLSGITWSLECVGNLRLARNKLYLKANGFSSNGSTVMIEWSFKRCLGIIAIIRNYEIQHRRLKHVDPCDADEKYDGPIDFTSANQISLNQLDLTTSFNLTDLEKYTLYAIQMRYELENGTRNDWSDPIIVQTSSLPDLPMHCFLENKWPLIRSILITSALVILICCCLIKCWLYVTNEVRGIRRSKAIVKQGFLDKLREKRNPIATEMTNFEVCDGLEDSSSSGPDESIDMEQLVREGLFELRSGARSAVPINGDYVQNALLNDHVDDDRSVSSDIGIDDYDSKLDDISEVSNSSFLENILN